MRLKPFYTAPDQPANQSLLLNLRRFDLWAWATYTDTQKVAMLLGSIPPKLHRQHEKALVLLSFPSCTQLIHSIQSRAQSHLARFLYPLLPSSLLLPRPLPPRMMLTTKYARVRLTNAKCSSVTYITQDGIWIVYSHLSPPSQLGLGIVPYVPFTTPRQQPETFTSPPPFSIPTPIKHRLARNKKAKQDHILKILAFSFQLPTLLSREKKILLLSLNHIPGIPTTIYQFKNKNRKNSTLTQPHLNFSQKPTCMPMIWGQDLKIKSSTWFAMGMGELGP